ncbi:vacJ like lipofamily protein [Lysobacter antibioticus]|uniref:VacJ like lipofamily protein n=1 Tax=Lysobacter antibioticus TaxID=84531 RepID=A0A0S2F3X6_LYSAN|nr:VacJ family lipoprotein [Lysobacter antibioticus]ALN62187.1 vacJ like lipofamily protein [Lysobacter antibioticus]ALN78232.1 vacJ like lipofamily protein [Lysobacter antibioticus]
MRPHALSLSLGLALAALHSVPAFAQDATPASAAEATLVSATAQNEPALATPSVESLALTDTATTPADAAATTPADTAQAATAEPALDYALAQVESSQAQPAQPDPNAPAAEAAEPPPATATGEPSAADDQRTEAERDFDALYGTPAQEYDPVADPTLPAPASVPGAFDPWEKYNRKMHRFNMAVDRGVARPLARAYSKVVPRPVRLGVSNFFNNLGQPVSILNALLQGKPKQAAQALGRFALNTTLGIGGIFDPASDAKLPNRSEDFGQTLGVWGWKRSRYVELPFFGPRTVRDSFGALGDAPLSPLRHVERDRIRIPLQGLQLVDVRAQLLPLDSLRDGAEDEYALVRDSWTQRRDYQIFGDRLDKNGDSALPEYLQDDSNPSVPADAMPVMPTDGGR